MYLFPVFSVYLKHEISSSVVSGYKISIKMTDIGGYDVECIQTVPSSYECSICHFILRKPKQTACEHRFCCDCLNACFTK